MIFVIDFAFSEVAHSGLEFDVFSVGRSQVDVPSRCFV